MLQFTSRIFFNTKFIKNLNIKTSLMSSLAQQHNEIPITKPLPKRRLKNLLQKWSNYWKQLYLDYREVGIDVVKEARQKPFKAAFYGGLISGSYLCAKQNPDEISFINQLRLYTDNMILVHESCHNPESAKHLKFLQQCLNAGIIRRLSLGVVSFMWLDNYDENCALYKTVCPHLGVEYMKFHERIVDIGFWNKWWKLNEKMIDYDVNFVN